MALKKYAVGLLLATVLLCQSAYADYLEVRRSATIKDRPERSAVVLERPDVGSLLHLVGDGRQQNGYYRVIAPSAGRQGWIYRTLVRRHRGDPPGGGPVVQPGTVPDDAAVQSGRVMRAHFIDMDQGDATLLEFACGAVLIDAGGSNQETTNGLIEYLTNFFARRSDLNNTLDTVFVTHTHTDHNRALREVVSRFTVRNYVHNGVLQGSGRGAALWMVNPNNDAVRSIRARAVPQSDIERLPNRTGLSDAAIDPVDCEVVNPDIRVLSGHYTENPGWPSGQFDNGNNKGLVVRIDFGEASFLFTGDLEEYVIEELVAYYNGTNLLNVDVYQVGHHGSHNGTSESLMRAMTPIAAVISMGNNARHEAWTAWAYGHPRRSLVDLLDQWISRPRQEARWVEVASAVRSFHRYRMNDAVYGTGWEGTIVVTADDRGNFDIRTGRAPGS